MQRDNDRVSIKPAPPLLTKAPNNQDAKPEGTGERIRQVPPTRALVLFCGVLMMLSGFSTDVMLPAFTVMTADLSTSMEMVQGTLSSFALCFGLSQIFYGPASDRFGRKPVIAVGMMIFVLGSIFCAFGTTIELVLFGRGLQGIGAGAAPVLARAILRDTHEGEALARVMSISFSIFAIGPIIAPLVGYGVLASTGWRTIFLSMGLLALMLLMFNLIKYRETNLHLNKDALRLGNLIGAFKQYLRHRQSSYFMACGATAYCALFTFLANSPRIYASEFGLDIFWFSTAFAICGFGILLGQYFNRALLPRWGVLKVLRAASSILLLASLGIGFLDWIDQINVWSFTTLMFFFNTSFLVVISNTAALCLDPHPKIAGLASAFYGMATNLTGAVFIALTGYFVGGGLANWSLTMIATTGLCAIFIWCASASFISSK